MKGGKCKNVHLHIPPLCFVPLFCPPPPCFDAQEGSGHPPHIEAAHLHKNRSVSGDKILRVVNANNLDEELIDLSHMKLPKGRVLGASGLKKTLVDRDVDVGEDAVGAILEPDQLAFWAHCRARRLSVAMPRTTLERGRPLL